MYFLLEICEHPSVLRVIYYARLFLDILFIVLPIGIILFTMIDFSKALINAGSSEPSKVFGSAGKRILSAIIVFAIPWIVGLFFFVLESFDFNVSYSACLINANSDAIANYDTLLAEEERLKEAEEALRREEEQGPTGIGGNAYTGTFYNGMAENLIRLIESRVGDTNAYNYGAWTDPKTGGPVAWCALFTTWALKNTNYNGINLFNDIIQRDYGVDKPAGAACMVWNFAHSDNLEFHYSEYYSKKLFNKSSNYIPKPGDVIFFRWSDGSEKQASDWNGEVEDRCIGGRFFYEMDHVGIVHYVENGLVHTIEGNCNKKVCSRHFIIDSPDIAGYGAWYSVSSYADTIKPNANPGLNQIR